jgi:cyclopropane-fatty-acyl-phospholipid synthase
MIRLRQRMLNYVSSRFAGDPPPLRLIFWDGECFDFATPHRVAITLHSRDAVKMLLRGDFAGLGDAYASGQISVEGHVEDVLQVGISLAERLGKHSLLKHVARLSRFIPRPHSRRKDAKDISFHYDVSNDFYRLWLDRQMIYSCAYFRTGAEDIDTAQADKLDHICRKLLLKPGDRLLDLGCGWGGLLHWAVKHYGVTAVGITLSERQYDYARESFAAERLDGKLDIRLQDYRDLLESGSFDKIVSVGMYEHVGIANLPTYFGTVNRLLRPGGAFLNHGIVSTDAHGRARGPAGGEFIDRHVFPGGAVPHLSRVLVELSRANLEFADAEDLRPHYARTLMLWARRLESNQADAIRAAGANRYRIWLMYLAGMAHAFDRRWLAIAQVLAFKPTENGDIRRPWTREYHYQGPNAATAARPPMSGGLEWERRTDVTALSECVQP